METGSWRAAVCAVALCGVAAQARAHEQAVQNCDDTLNQPARECMIAALQTARHACNAKTKLAAEFKRVGLRAGVRYSEAVVAARKLSRDPGLRFRVIFRPAALEDHGVLLAMNPHDRSDVEVCKTHRVELYVGRSPLRTMPAETLVRRSLAEAQGELESVVDANGMKVHAKPWVCWPDDASPAGSAKVVAQWPAASGVYGKSVPLARFDMPDQRPVLVVRPEVPICPSCGDCESSRMREPVPERTNPDEGGGDALAGGAAGLGAGLILARLMRGGGAPEPRGPKRPAGTGGAMPPPARVRPDIDLPDSRDEVNVG